jgi:ribosome-binding factor A
MKSHRIPRLQEELKKLLNIALNQKMRNHDLDWVSITEIELSKDLRYAKLFFSHYNNPATHDEIKAMLIKATGFFKNQIAGAHIMRTIPELSFHYDDSEDRAEKVDILLASIKDRYNDDEDDEYDPDIDLDDYMDDDDVFDVDEDEEIYNEFIEDEENDEQDEDKEN